MKLTASEKLLVHRMYHGWTQREAAKHWRVGFWAYRAWEENPNAVPGMVRRVAESTEVTKQARYVILRRREGMTQAELAAQIGVSRQWLNRMEVGLESDSLLRDYWATC